VSGRRIRIMENYFFNKKYRLYWQYRNPIANTYDFKYHFENGLPKSFVSFQDTNQLHNKICFKNGKMDSLESYYPNGELEYEASLINGELNGYFIFYHSNGDEKFKVYFESNKIYHFINKEGRYDYNEIIRKWMLN
jgi:antitoxin component YwqK of YwqJK toxin-antitoxin module